MIGSSLGDTNLEYICHRVGLSSAIENARNEREDRDIKYTYRQKDLMGGKERQSHRRKTRNGYWNTPVPHRLNVKYLYQEKL